MAFKPNPVQQAIKDDFSRIHVFFYLWSTLFVNQRKAQALLEVRGLRVRSPPSRTRGECNCGLSRTKSRSLEGSLGLLAVLCSNSGGIVGRIYVIIFTEFTLEPSLACQRLRKSAVGCVNIAPAASSEGAVQPLHRTSVSFQSEEGNKKNFVLGLARLSIITSLLVGSPNKKEAEV